MKRIAFISTVILFIFSACQQPTEVEGTDLPDTSVRNQYYVGNQIPLLSTPFTKLPVGSIEPKGWVRKQLELQADGYFGHLGEISKFLIKENNSWLSPDGTGDHGWEEVPYWLKGYSNLSYLLGREDMLAETKLWIEAIFSSQKDDGWFGPDKGRTGAATDLEGREDLWPNMIVLFILQDYYSYSNDDRVINLMRKYFDYLKTIPEENFLVGYWPSNRGGDLLYSIYWLYNRTLDKSLFDLADKVHKKSVNWTDGIPNWHNVNMSQSFGEPTTYYMQTLDPKHLEASNRNYEKIRELYGQVPGATFGSDENCREGYTDPRQAFETCGMVEMMLSTEILFTITGDPVWADRCEDVAFNSYPAALTADMKALRYLTAPNLVQSDAVSKSPGIQNGGPMFHMDPNRHRCCQHNQGHGWPYYAEHLWLASSDNGLAAAFYSENSVQAKVGDGIKVMIDEKTNYPFDDKIVFSIHPDDPVRFPLYLRIPGWCKRPAVKINGEDFEFDQGKNLIKINKTWLAGDLVELSLPMELGLREWTANKNSVSVDYGPLSFSLKIAEDYRKEGGSEKWPAWGIYPASNWNYGLLFDQSNLNTSFKIVKKAFPENNMPFTQENNPIEIQTKGALIDNWVMDETNLVKELPQSPVQTSNPIEDITLIPMGSARLRISSFPVIK